ncbi:porin [Burkholderia gladioli]|uniref:porin n=1 Tax=Burkholderia gladioli TaxID=28095 RepID=UPI0013DF548E|nr:porin [Burkholderia gladioli]
MKKYIALIGCAGLYSIGHAQSSVTIYGLIDNGVAYFDSLSTSAKLPGHSRISADSPFALWGFKGNEDLGNGLSATFVLENGFNGYTGSSLQGGRLFGRQSTVGITSRDYGSVTLGRQYDIGFDYVGTRSASIQFMGVYGAHIGDNDNMFSSVRLQNSVKYQSPRFGGFDFGGMYAFSNQAGNFANNSAYNFGLRYTGSSFAIGGAYTKMRSPSAGQSATDNPGGAQGGEYVIGASQIFASAGFVNEQTIARLALSYFYGPGTYNLVLSETRYTYADASRLKLHNYELNARYALSPAWFVGVAYIFTDGNATGAANSSGLFQGNNPQWHQVDAVMGYQFSKRTSVLLKGVYQVAAGSGSIAAINLSGYVSGSNQKSMSMMSLGLRHIF